VLLHHAAFLVSAAGSSIFGVLLSFPSSGHGISLMIGVLLRTTCCVLHGLRCFAQAKHIRKAELADAISVRNLALSLAEFTASVKFYIAFKWVLIITISDAARS